MEKYPRVVQRHEAVVVMGGYVLLRLSRVSAVPPVTYCVYLTPFFLTLGLSQVFLLETRSQTVL